MMYGNLAMSYNMMDTRLYERVDCAVEQHYHRKFASYQKYAILVGELGNNFKVKLNLIIEQNEANDPQYAEVVVTKTCTIDFNQIYGSDPFEKLVKGLDAVLNPYYIVEGDGGQIILTAKIKGKVPSIQTPAIELYSDNNIKLIEDTPGTDTEIFVMRPNEIHIPKPSKGQQYKVPKIGDVVYIIDQVKSVRDRTFIRTVTSVEENARCTCDVLTLDLPIDRLDNHGRINGIGLQSTPAISNNYTASFNKTKLWKRKDNFSDLLESQKNMTGDCVIPIYNHMKMHPVVDQIMSKLDFNSFQYFGTFFHWTDFKDLLKPFHDVYGEYLRDELNVLKSSNERPDYLLHIDYDEEQKDMPVVGSFTWPALNCDDNTTTVWYECIKDGSKVYKVGKQDVVITDNNLILNEIDRWVFNTEEFNSVVFKHNDWHTVYNGDNSGKQRMLLQWRFKPELSWDQIKKILHTHRNEQNYQL